MMARCEFDCNPITGREVTHDRGDRSPHRVDPDDQLRLPDEVQYELVDGRLVELPMSSLSNYVATRLATSLSNFGDATGFDFVFVEAGYACFPNRPNRMRRPDVS